MSIAAGEATWLGIATQEDGQEELAGAAANNPRIQEYLQKRAVPGGHQDGNSRHHPGSSR